MNILSGLQDLNPYIWALLIFCFRIIDVSLGTYRVQLIVSRKKLLAGFVGFCEVFIFILVISKVIQDVGNFINVLAYSSGFGAGNIVGITISEKLSREMISIVVISRTRWLEIEQKLREEGFGVTRNIGYGLQGELQILQIMTRRNVYSKIREIALKYDPKAFITSYLVVGSSGGYIYNVKSKT